jgi:hypothetical protein
MKRRSFFAAIIFGFCATAMSQTTRQAYIRTFELTPVAPPIPALKYQLLYTETADQRSGNAAILYLDSILLMGPEDQSKAETALSAFDANDAKTFGALAESLSISSLLAAIAASRTGQPIAHATCETSARPCRCFESECALAAQIGENGGFPENIADWLRDGG